MNIPLSYLSISISYYERSKANTPTMYQISTGHLHRRTQTWGPLQKYLLLLVRHYRNK